jgi:hypothetical protein
MIGIGCARSAPQRIPARMRERTDSTSRQEKGSATPDHLVSTIDAYGPTRAWPAI